MFDRYKKQLKNNNKKKKRKRNQESRENIEATKELVLIGIIGILFLEVMTTKLSLTFAAKKLVLCAFGDTVVTNHIHNL